MRFVCIGICFALVGCGVSKADSSVHGSPADVSTAPGTYDGYLVVNECQYARPNFGVVGSGTAWFNDVAPGDDSRPAALSEFAHGVIGPALDDVASVWGIGWGLACEGVGVSVDTNDWRDVDPIIGICGAILRDNKLREEIAISVGEVPVAQVSGS